MKVINMQIKNDKNLAKAQPGISKNDQQIRQICCNFLKILKEDQNKILQNVRQYITADKLTFLSKIFQYFLSNANKINKQEDHKQGYSQSQKILHQNLQNTTRKLNQSILLNKHLRQKLNNKQSELLKKNKLLYSLRRQSQTFRQKFRKDVVLKQLSLISPNIVNSLQLMTKSFKKPYQIQLNFQEPTTKQKDIFQNTQVKFVKSINQQENKRLSTSYVIGFQLNYDRKRKNHQSRMLRKTFSKSYRNTIQTTNTNQKLNDDKEYGKFTEGGGFKGKNKIKNKQNVKYFTSNRLQLRQKQTKLPN